VSVTPNALPSYGGGVTLSASKSNYPNEWKALQTYVGYSEIGPLMYGNNGSYITDFFLDFNVAFTEYNIKTFAPIIKVYASQKLKETISIFIQPIVVQLNNMKLIREYKEYTLMDKISDKLSDIFPNIKIVNNVLLASSILDKSGKPNVRIDSKIPLKALMLKFEKNSIEIKSIVNSTAEKGLSQEVMRIILSSIDKDWIIIIDKDVSNGFWDKVIQKHPEYNWVKN
jgi:hypothetical protein